MKPAPPVTSRRISARTSDSGGGVRASSPGRQDDTPTSVTDEGRPARPPPTGLRSPGAPVTDREATSAGRRPSIRQDPPPPGPYGPPRGRAGRPGARPGLPPDLDPRGREQRLGPADPGGPGPGGPAGWDPYPVRRRHPALAALRVLGAALSVLVLVTSGLMWFLYRDFTGNIGRVNAIGATADDVDGRDQNILLVGSDDRSTATDAELRELST